jgi:transposase
LSFNGGISKCGDHLLRTYLFEAANALMTRSRKWSALKAWGMRFANRRGVGKAKVAVSRKLAITMHVMWLTGGPFCWSSETEANPI